LINLTIFFFDEYFIV